MHPATRKRVTTILLWCAIVVTVCTLAGGWTGLVYGSVGMLAGSWVTWTSEQHANH